MTEYTFFVDVNDGECASFKAESLNEAKEMFKESFPKDFDKIKTITSLENGYEEIL